MSESAQATATPLPEKENKGAAGNNPTTDNNGPTKSVSHSRRSENSNSNETDLCDSLFRVTKGLPRRELNLMVTEADECETILVQEIQVLEQALEAAERNENDKEETAIPVAAQEILKNSLTPMDRYWTASALLGRLREDWLIPSILQAAAAMNRSKSDSVAVHTMQLTENMIPPPSRHMQAFLNMTRGSDDIDKSVSILRQQYTKTHEASDTLLAVWKKISTHRSSSVFKRAVKPEEAPGYTERIVFPMDLSMIRKLVVARHVKSYEELHEFVGLIAHNCVKYNGRESDYGNVAREFEAVADEIILQAVEQAAQIERAGSTTKQIETVSSGEGKEVDNGDTKHQTDAMDVVEDE